MNTTVTYTTHLYLVLYPNHALIASQLEPGQFAKHYTQGSTRFFEGKLFFVEIDPTYRNPYFAIDETLKELTPHEDGRPKATKFISSYRTLEHIDFNALGKLYCCNALGNYVELTSAEIDPKVRGDEMRILLEITPIRMMVLTKMNFSEYGNYITAPGMPKGAPVMFYSQLEYDINGFLEEFEENPFVQSAVPGIHPARLRDAILEVRTKPAKSTKGLTLDCPVDRIPYKRLRHGFMFASHTQERFYPLLPIDEVEKKYYKFWKNM